MILTMLFLGVAIFLVIASQSEPRSARDRIMFWVAVALVIIAVAINLREILGLANSVVPPERGGQ